MPHAQTIAMARGLLAEGRGADVARMIAPLLEADGHAGNDGAGDEALVLRGLWARVRLLRAGDAAGVLDALGAYADSAARAALAPAVRAETALWLGWATAWQDARTFDDARALGLFDEADRAFRAAHDASGRCWAALGRAATFHAIDEPGLMRAALDEADALRVRLRDAEADLWADELHLFAERGAGAYARAEARADALARTAEALDDPFAAARARVYRAALDYDLGRAPAAVAHAAEAAAEALGRHAVHPGAALRTALVVRARALLRAGTWDAAEAGLADGEAGAAEVRHGAAYLRVERARLATLRGRYPDAHALLDAVESGTSTSAHRRLAAALALVRAEVLRREGRTDEALAVAERAWLGAREADDNAQALRALLDLADTLRAAGRPDDARARLADADRYGALLGHLPPAAYRFGIQGRLALAAGRREEAHALFAQALAGYTLIGDLYGQACMQRAVATTGSDGAAPLLLGHARATFSRLGCPEAEAGPYAAPTAPPAGDEPRETEAGTLAEALARASLSVDLIAEAWLQAAEAWLPGAWLGVFRCGEDGAWSAVHVHDAGGDADPGPVDRGALDPPDPSADEAERAGVHWLRLRGGPGPAFFFAARTAGPAWADARERLRTWRPVAALALDHALLRAQRLAPVAEADEPLPDFVCASPPMREIAALLRRLHASHSPVLITGEAGAGKGAVARALHAASERREAPLVVFDAAATPPALAERALFGAADAPDAPGALRRAEGGTLVVAEVAELPADAQRGLLRFLRDGSVFPAGAAAPRRANVRLVATTRHDLAARVRSGRFREDLLHRLGVIPIHVPPLRERREEVPLLLRHFLDRLRAPGVPRPSVTNRAMDALLHYDWPGNVRQLRNEAERALTLVASEPAPTIDLAVLSPALHAAAGDGTPGPAPATPDDRILQPGVDLDTLLAATERALIERVLGARDGSVTASAEVLGLTRQGLYKKMKRLGIDPARFTRPDPAIASS